MRVAVVVEYALSTHIHISQAQSGKFCGFIDHPSEYMCISTVQALHGGLEMNFMTISFFFFWRCNCSL